MMAHSLQRLPSANRRLLLWERRLNPPWGHSHWLTDKGKRTAPLPERICLWWVLWGVLCSRAPPAPPLSPSRSDQNQSWLKPQPCLALPVPLSSFPPPLGFSLGALHWSHPQILVSGSAFSSKAREIILS